MNDVIQITIIKEKTILSFPLAAILTLLLTTTGVYATTSVSGFDRYKAIIDRQPFGEIAPADEPQPEVVATPSESFVNNLTMRAIIDDGFTVRIGVLDKKQQKNIYLTLGEISEGIELVSVDYNNEEATLRKGQETAVLSLRSESAVGRTAATTPTSTPSKTLARRRPFLSNVNRQAPSNMQTEGSNTDMRGKTIEAFLREHPEAAMQIPSPLRPSDSANVTQHRGETIEKLLRENPDAAKRFSPLQTRDPSARQEGRGEITERFMQEHSGESQEFEVPAPVFISPEAVPFLFEDLHDDE